MGYIKPGVKKALKIQSNNAVTHLMPLLTYLSFVSYGGAIVFRLAMGILSRRQ